MGKGKVWVWILTVTTVIQYLYANTVGEAQKQ